MPSVVVCRTERHALVVTCALLLCLFLFAGRTLRAVSRSSAVCPFVVRSLSRGSGPTWHQSNARGTKAGEPRQVGMYALLCSAG
jgi:hypothetical protein